MFRLLIVLVVFVSQLGNGYNHDCGGASMAMVIHYHTGMKLSASDVMDVVGKDRYLSSYDLYRTMKSFGLKMAYGDEVPRIVLVHGNHWVVYLGDGYYHDPLNGPFQRGWLGPGYCVETVKNDKLDLLLR